MLDHHEEQASFWETICRLASKNLGAKLHNMMARAEQAGHFQLVFRPFQSLHQLHTGCKVLWLSKMEIMGHDTLTLLLLY